LAGDYLHSLPKHTGSIHVGRTGKINTIDDYSDFARPSIRELYGKYPPKRCERPRIQLPAVCRFAAYYQRPRGREAALYAQVLPEGCARFYWLARMIVGYHNPTWPSAKIIARIKWMTKHREAGFYRVVQMADRHAPHPLV
jgi:hypothetical protein